MSYIQEPKALANQSQQLRPGVPGHPDIPRPPVTALVPDRYLVSGFKCFQSDWLAILCVLMTEKDLM